MVEELKGMVGKNERILFEGKPDKRCFILESVFNRLLPFAIIWAVFDLVIFSGFSGRSEMPKLHFLYLLLHLMPVWMYLYGVLFSFRRYKNSYYIVTDHAVYVSGGVFSMNLESKTFAEMAQIHLHRGIIDQFFNVGDIYLTTNQVGSNNKPVVISINSIVNYSEVFHMVKKLQKDIYADTMYPNDLRPDENHGYRTKYKG